MQRAIIALSVVSRDNSMAAVLHLLHAINPGRAAVGRFQGLANYKLAISSHFAIHSINIRV
jgi:hypothetical protein